MDGSAILYAGLGAGLGSLLGGFIASRISNKAFKSWVTVLPMIIGWQGTVALYKNMKLPRIFPMDKAALDAENPAFRALKDSDPGEYEALVRILDEPTRKGNLDQSHLNEFRTKFTSLIETKRGMAPPELLRKQNTLAAEQFRILRIKNPEICTAQANGRSFPVLTSILGEEFASKEQKLMAQLFYVKPSDLKGNAESGGKVYTEILANIIQDLGIKTFDPSGDDLDAINTEHQLICKFLEKSMSEVNLLDDASILDVAAFVSKEALK